MGMAVRTQCLAPLHLMCEPGARAASALTSTLARLQVDGEIFYLDGEISHPLWNTTTTEVAGLGGLLGGLGLAYYGVELLG